MDYGPYKTFAAAETDLIRYRQYWGRKRLDAAGSRGCVLKMGVAYYFRLPASLPVVDPGEQSIAGWGAARRPDWTKPSFGPDELLEIRQAENRASRVREEAWARAEGFKSEPRRMPERPWSKSRPWSMDYEEYAAREERRRERWFLDHPSPAWDLPEDAFDEEERVEWDNRIPPAYLVHELQLDEVADLLR